MMVVALTTTSAPTFIASTTPGSCVPRCRIRLCDSESPRVSTEAPVALSAFEQYYRAQHLMGDDELPAFFEQLRRPLPLDVRASARASLASRAASALQQLQQDDAIHGRALHWAGEGVWQWPACAQASRQFLHQQMLRGALQRQESASMLPALVLAPRASHAVLDMCAAPGSKSIQAIELMESDWALGEALAEAEAEAAATAAAEEEEEAAREGRVAATAAAAGKGKRVRCGTWRTCRSRSCRRGSRRASFIKASSTSRATTHARVPSS